MHDNVRGQVPKVKVTYEHSICQHCDDAPCIEACNAHAIYKRDDGIVIIDPDKCRGNQMCMAACPYENVIYFNDALNIAQKCTFCAHLLDDGWSEPRCADACPTGAFTFGDEDDPRSRRSSPRPSRSSRRSPRSSRGSTTSACPRSSSPARCSTRKPTSAPKGVTVTATNNSTGEKSVAATDSYGDFWLRDLKDGVYTLLIEKPGYLTQKFGPVDVTQKDMNVGDIAIWKA